MTDYTNEQLLEMYHKLPKDVQEAILSVDTSEAIREIGEKHKLMIDKMGDLADETGLVMLGLTHPSQYVSHLIERLGINQETAQEITEEINNKIFFPIRESLRKIQEEREATAERPRRSRAGNAGIRQESRLLRLTTCRRTVGKKPVPEMPSPAFETATLVPPSLTLPETPTPPISPVAATYSSKFANRRRTGYFPSQNKRRNFPAAASDC